MIEAGEIFGLDGGRGNRPPTVRKAIDIEMLLQWAVARSGRLPWRRDDERELSLDRGCTARPRRRPVVTWALAEACAGLRLGGGRGLPALSVPGPDADLVLAAVRRLADPAIAGIVIACARAKIRPDWMPGVEPRRVERGVRCRRRHRRVVRLVWEPCAPEAIRAARAVYARWHAALLALQDDLAGRLDGWEISGFGAPAQPWAMPVAQTA